MTALFAHTIVPSHRVLFVVATALLGVSGSFVATNPDCVANWMSFIGTGTAMYVGDVCGEIDNSARRLAARGDAQLGDLRETLVRDNGPKLLLLLFCASVVLVLVGFVYGG
jgi:hypothetical protein